MKYSNYFGVIFSVMVIGVCFLPWVYIESINTTVTGLQTGVTNFGKPGLMNIFLTFIAILLFISKSSWAKRANLFATTFNFAWAIRNYLVITQCAMGECPVKKTGIYLLVLLSVFMLVFSLLPPTPAKVNRQ